MRIYHRDARNEAFVVWTLREQSVVIHWLSGTLARQPSHWLCTDYGVRSHCASKRWLGVGAVWHIRCSQKSVSLHWREHGQTSGACRNLVLTCQELDPHVCVVCRRAGEIQSGSACPNKKGCTENPNYGFGPMGSLLVKVSRSTWCWHFRSRPCRSCAGPTLNSWHGNERSFSGFRRGCIHAPQELQAWQDRHEHHSCRCYQRYDTHSIHCRLFQDSHNTCPQNLEGFDNAGDSRWKAPSSSISKANLKTEVWPDHVCVAHWEAAGFPSPTDMEERHSDLWNNIWACLKMGFIQKLRK